MYTTKQKAKHKTFFGEAGGSFLAYWLNGPGGTPWQTWREAYVERYGLITGTLNSDDQARARVIPLLRMLKQLGEMEIELYGENNKARNQQDYRLFSALAASVSTAYARYPGHSVIQINPLVVDETGQQKPLWAGQRGYRWAHQPASPVLFQELIAVRFIEEGDEQGWLNQVRECRVCQRWFFARKRGQHHCSPKCGKKEYQSTEKYRAWRHRHYLNHVKRRQIAKQVLPRRKAR
jgi:hypothetical protein